MYVTKLHANEDKSSIYILDEGNLPRIITMGCASQFMDTRLLQIIEENMDCWR